ncbi:MAG: hypothetical protein UW66_C0061G0009 [Candidatus Moranbacteria bacterium GW2011_GWF1_44_4]|nr:MAG: hypothetical protein UW66_C0061G0009 [Candidatus Moranbacteria bacterium GW2011_GWF1_44_4]
MEKHPKVTYFLRNFVKHYGDRSRDSEGNAYQKTPGNKHSVNKIVDKISDDIHIDDRMNVLL